MALPATIVGLHAYTAPVGPFKGTRVIGYGAKGIGTGLPLGSTTANLRLAQQFTLTAGMTPTHVTVPVYRTGTALTDSLMIDVYATAGGLPTTKIGSAAIGGGLIGTNSKYYTAAFMVPPTLEPDVMYALVFWRSSDSAVAGSYYNLFEATSELSAGNRLTHDGAAWATSNTTDISFTIGLPVEEYYLFGRDAATATTLQALRATDPSQDGASFYLQTTTDTSTGSFLGFSGGFEKGSQSITTTTAINVDAVGLILRKQGAPVDDWYVTVFAADAAGLPTGPVLGTSSAVNGATITTSNAEYRFAFGTPVALAAATKYCFVFQRSGALSGTNDVAWTGTSSGAYTGGVAAKGDGGAFALAGTPADFGIKIFTPGAWGITATKTGFTTAILHVTGYQFENVIHLVVNDGTAVTSMATKYVSFDISTGAFQVAIETVKAASNCMPLNVNAVNQIPASVVVRSNGEAVAFFNGTQVKASGSFYSRVYYSRRTGPGSWSAPVQVDASTGSDNFGCAAALGASDSIHFSWSVYANNLMHRTLSAANALQTASTALTAYGYSQAGVTNRGVSYLRSATMKVAISGMQSSVVPGVARFDSANTPTLAGSAVHTGTQYPAFPRPFADGTNLHVLFWGTISGTSTTLDIYSNKSTDDGASWGTPVRAGIYGTMSNDTGLSIDAKPYQRGTAIVLPHTVNVAGVLKYNEYIIRYVAQADAWNPNDNVDMSLSNADKTATVNVSTAAYIRSTTTYLANNTGKRYAEFHFPNVTGVGTSPLRVALDKPNVAGTGGPLSILYHSNGDIYFNQSVIGTNIGTIASGDTICVAWDEVNGRFWFRKNEGLWNGLAGADPSTNTGGHDISGVPTSHEYSLQFLGVNAPASSCTIRTEVADLAFQGPIGFTSWMGEVIPIANAWHLGDKTTNVYLSNGDRNAYSSVANEFCRSAKAQPNSGTKKLYAEFVGVNLGSGDLKLGFAQALPFTLASTLATAVYVTSAGSIVVNGTTYAGLLAPHAANAVTSVAWDVGAELVWFRRDAGDWNGDASADPETGVGGFSTSTLAGVDYALWGNFPSAINVLIRTDKDNLTQTPPAEFSSWMDEELAIPGWPVQSLVGASPVFSVPAFKQIHPLTALPINLSVYSYTTAPIVQRHVLAAPIATVGGVPVFGALLFKQVVPFSTPSLIVAPYTIGVPATMTQAHKIIAPAMAVPSWSYVSAPIAQTHAITPIDKAAGAPVFGATGITLVVPMFADDFTTSAPVIAAADATIKLALAASGFVGTGFGYANAVIHEINLLSAANLATGPPVLPATPWGVQRTFTAAAFATSAPTIGASALTQRHPCIATSHVTSAPSFGAATFNQVYTLTAALAASSPTIGGSSINQTQVLPAPLSIFDVTPVIPIGFMGQAGVFTPLPVVAGIPAVGVGALAQRQVLTAAYAAKSPVISSAIYSKNILPASIAGVAPSIGAPGLAVALDADAFEVLAPAIGTPTLRKVLTATNLAIGVPALAAGVIKQRHVLAADPLVVAPDIPIGYLSQAGVFSLVPLNVSEPVIGTAAFGQLQVLASAVTLSVSAPSIGSTTYGRVIKPTALAVASPTFTGSPLRKVLAASGLVAPAAVFDEPPWLAVSITAADLAPAPAIGAATIKQLHVLAGSSIAVLSPLTSPVVLGQAGVLQFMPLVAGQPVFSVPPLKQRHVLSATAATVELPTIDASAIEQVHRFDIEDAPQSIGVTAPVLGTRAITQKHVLVAVLAPVSPAIAINTLRQAHRLTAPPFVVAPYALGVPTIEAISNFEPLDRITSAPAIGAPLFKQRHAVETTPLDVAPPELPELTLNIIGKMTALQAKAGAPVFGQPDMELDQDLVGANLTVGAISLPHIPIGIRAHLAAPELVGVASTFTAPSLGQHHVLAATRIMPYPAIGEAQIGQDHSLTAADLVAGRPVVRVGFFGQAGTMAAIPLWVASPILPALAPRERHRLAAIGADAGAPSLGLATIGAVIAFPRAQSTYAGRFKGPAPVLGQAHQLIASTVTAGAPRALLPKLTASAPLGQPAQAVAGSPALGAPLMAVSSRLVPVGMRFGYPSLGRPQLVQEHVLAARDLETLGPLFQQIGFGAADLALDPIGIETAPPVLGEPRPPSRRARLYAIANVTGKRGNHVTITGRRHRTAI